MRYMPSQMAAAMAAVAKRVGAMKLGEIAAAIGAELHGDPDVEIVGVAAIEEAGPGELTFVASGRYGALLSSTRAAAVILPRGAPEVGIPSLRTADPYLAFARALELFCAPARPAPQIHPTAAIAPDAKLGEGAYVGAYVVIGEGVEIGARAVIHPHVVIYPRVHVGDDFTAHAHAVVREGVRIGHRVTLHAGAVIGSDGFGFVPAAEGNVKIPQAGTVILEDEVEVGACTTVDRATLGATVVGRGTKLDNLVMIGHGSRLGPGCLVAAQAGLAGSTKVGARVMMGGQAGIAGHLVIGDGARLGARSAVHRDVPAGAVQAGYPALDAQLFRRLIAALPKVPDMLRRLRRIERRLGLGTHREGEEPAERD